MKKLSTYSEAEALGFDLNTDFNINYVTTNHADFSDCHSAMIEILSSGYDGKTLLQVTKVTENLESGALEELAHVIKTYVREASKHPNSIFSGVFNYKDSYKNVELKTEYLLFDSAIVAHEYMCEITHPKYR